ncbi:uncharacterized protein V2V93DRAFT_365063 [Kockiozyma suomiensis]|uniref:uncharacterized protein n=1 Tax=Kockiozyma suomiensis TaxID=1337062 RepID=UPI00334316BD
MAAKKTPPPLDLPTVSNIAGTSDETRLNRQDVLGLLSRRKECSLREYLQFACDLPLRIEDASPCRPIIRYFAICKDVRGRETATEITSERSLDLGEVQLPTSSIS